MMVAVVDSAPLSDEAYLAGADAGRAAAKSSLAVDDAIHVDMYSWQIEREIVGDWLLESFCDGWLKAYYDARAKMRAATSL